MRLLVKNKSIMEGAGGAPNMAILQDPMALIRYFAYTHPDCVPSKNLHESVMNHQRRSKFIKFQDVTELEGIPEWLDGTPTIVRRKDGQIFRGSAAFEVLKEII